MINVRFDTGDPIKEITVYYGDEREDTYSIENDGTEMILSDIGDKRVEITLYDSDGEQQQYTYRRYTKVHTVWVEDDDDEPVTSNSRYADLMREYS